MPEKVISVERLTKRFGRRLAVEDLSFSVASGEVVALLGPNGAGKTTTVRILACLIQPTQGVVQVLGREISLPQHQFYVRSRIGLLTESPGIYDRASTRYNLVYFARLHGLESPGNAADKYLQELGLWDHRDAPAASLSKGLKQRLAIARSLVHEPDLIFLDEPTSGLDPAAARQVRDFLRSLQGKGRTILLTTHNLNEAESLADRILVMKTGLVAADTPSALRERLFGHRVRIELSDANDEGVSSIRALPFVKEIVEDAEGLTIQVENPEEQNPLLVRLLVEAGVDVRWVRDGGASLEDVYLELVDAAEKDARGNST